MAVQPARGSMYPLAAAHGLLWQSCSMPVILARASQQAAGYKPEGGVERCGYCRFYVTQGTCNRIIGPVSPRGWCRFFSRMVYLRLDSGSDNDFTGTSGPPGVTQDLNFTTGSLPSGITFTRASTATYYDNTGTKRTAAANAPRFDYNPSTLKLNGLLLEEARTNIATNSGNLSLWTASATVLTANADTAPDGTVTMTRIAENSQNGIHMVTSNFTVTASSVYTATLYAKMAQTRWIQFALDDGVNGVHATFDLQAGTVSGPIAAHGAGATAGTATIQPVGNSVYRMQISGTGTSSTTGRFAILLSNTANPAWAASYQGNVANGLSAWGAQLELGAFPTSYIPTTSAAVARSGDVANLPLGAWFTQGVGSLVSENIWSGRNPAGGFPRVVNLDDGTANNYITHLLADTTGKVYSTDAVAGTGGWNLGVNGAYAVNTLFKVGTAWQAAAQSYALNGANYMTSAIATVPTGLTFMRFGSDQTGTVSSQAVWLQRVRYWPRLLTNAEMLSVTT